MAVDGAWGLGAAGAWCGAALGKSTASEAGAFAEGTIYTGQENVSFLL